MQNQIPIIVNSLTELQSQVGTADAIALVTGRSSRGDSKGGFYWWDATSSDTESLTYMSVISVTGVSVGRWKRINQTVQTLPQGILLIINGIKTFYGSTLTDVNGDITINLTLDNTTNGTAIFTEVWFNDSKSTISATSPSTAISSYVKSVSANLKQTVHGFYKANAVTVTLGLVYAPFATVGSNVPIQFKIEGV